MERCIHKHFTITYLKTTFLNLLSLILCKVTLQLSNFYTHTIFSYKQYIVIRNYELYFVVSARPLTESGTGGYYINWLEWDYLRDYLAGFKAMSHIDATCYTKWCRFQLDRRSCVSSTRIYTGTYFFYLYQCYCK